MPRCYMVKKNHHRHQGPPPYSPTEASVAPPCYSPAEHSTQTEHHGADHAEPERRLVPERSAADTEAAHDLLSLAQSLPPLPPATVVTVLHAPEPTPLVPLYTYTIQPTNIYILADEPLTEPIYQTVQTLTPIEYTVEPQVNYIAYSAPIPAESQPEYREPEYRDSEYRVPEFRVPEYRVPDFRPSELPPPESSETEFSESECRDPEPDEPASQEPVPQEPECPEPDSEQEESNLVIYEPEEEPTTSLKDKSAKYDCNECGKRYATSSNLSRHKQTHRSLDSVAAKRCGECGKAYVSMPALAMHVLTHRMGHVCGVCGKQFSRPWLLRGHLRSHTGEKPYNCGSCGKAFADRSNLRAHLQTHSSDKKYECPRCHKTFALKSYLNKHQESACVRSDDE